VLTAVGLTSAPPASGGSNSRSGCGGGSGGSAVLLPGAEPEVSSAMPRPRFTDTRRPREDVEESADSGRPEAAPPPAVS
jgi:hypothetical protein